VYLSAVAWAVGLEDQEASGVAVVSVSVVDKVVGKPAIGQLGAFVGGALPDLQFVGVNGAVAKRLSFGNANVELTLRAAKVARYESRCMMVVSIVLCNCRPRV
jgi:hypothetical protein